MSKRNAVSYVKQDEPAFLKAFKQKIGYKEGPDVDTKRQPLPPVDDGDDDKPELDDEKPQIVVLKKGDLTAEEVENITKKVEKEGTTFEIGPSQGEEEGSKDGKIVFRKPTKRQSEDNTSDLNTTSSKKKKEELKKKNTSKATKNSSLLSFGDDEDEEESDE